MKKMTTYLIIVAVISILVGGFLLFLKGNSKDNETNLGYQKVTLADIMQSPGQWDNKNVEYTGVFNSMFETSNLDGKIWLTSSANTIFKPNKDGMPGINGGYDKAQVVARGRLQTKKIPSNYGHLGGYPYQIIADEIELITPIYNSNKSMGGTYVPNRPGDALLPPDDEAGERNSH